MQYFTGQACHSYIAKTAGLMLLLLPLLLVAEDEKTAEQVCGETEIRYRDDPSLSRTERLVLMEKAFYDSVNRFEACELVNQPAAANTDNAGGGGSNAAGEGLPENSATASQQIRGTEAELEMPPPMAEQNSQNTEIGDLDTSASAGNGAIPEDIPAANNDDAIAAQIRLAAELETDPQIREKLWNEYRKYKGLDVVE